jgi:hypothetical protein
MPLVSIEELCQQLNLTRRQVDVRLKKFKEVNPSKYDELTTMERARIYYQAEISHELIDIIEISRTLKREKPIEPTVIEQIQREQPKQPKQYSVIEISRETETLEQRIILTKNILHSYKTGVYTMTECVAQHGIKLSMFFYWVQTDAEIKALYDEAISSQKEIAFQIIRDAALQQLRKMITGFETESSVRSFQEKVGPNGEQILIPQEQKVLKKNVLPRADLIMFALTNRDADSWKRIFSKEATPETPTDPLDSLSDHELMSYIHKAKSLGLLSENDNIT